VAWRAFGLRDDDWTRENEWCGKRGKEGKTTHGVHVLRSGQWLTPDIPILSALSDISFPSGTCMCWAGGQNNRGFLAVLWLSAISLTASNVFVCANAARVQSAVTNVCMISPREFVHGSAEPVYCQAGLAHNVCPVSIRVSPLPSGCTNAGPERGAFSWPRHLRCQRTSDNRPWTQCLKSKIPNKKTRLISPCVV